MSENGKESPSEDRLSEDEEPILLTEEFSSSEQEDDEVIDLTEAVEDDGAEIMPGASLTPEQIDRALERTIEKLYGQRIESLLLEVVQNKVSAEIEKIKKSLRDD